MDEALDEDLFAVRSQWKTAEARTVAATLADRRKVERASGRTSAYWTGRVAQLNIRMTTETKADTHAQAKLEGKSIAEFYEDMFRAYLANGGER